jgi:adenine deaminase
VTKNSIIADNLNSNFKNSFGRMVLNVIGHTILFILVISQHTETNQEIPNEIVGFGLHDGDQEATKSCGCNLCQLTK